MKIGIDLGTTNSCAAYINEDGIAVTIAEEAGNTIPSAISKISDDGFSVGRAARERAMRAPEDTVISAKRLIGKPWYEASEIAEVYGMSIGKGFNNEPLIRIGGKSYTIPQISGEVLTAVKLNAEKRLGKRITGAVITVPAYFNNAQREATRQAGVFAGLEVEAIISEPTAAALAYDKEGLIAVYDLGGGTFDISIVKKENGKAVTIATGGDLHLGGDDIDTAVLKILAREVEKEFNITLLDKNGKAVDKSLLVPVQRLRNAAEKLKIMLGTLISETNQYPEKETVLIRQLINGQDFEATLSFAQLRQAIKPFADRTLKCAEEALAEAGISKSDLDAVVLVGGSTKSPYIRQRIEEFFGVKPDTSLNPDEAVALGAAKSIDLSNKDAFTDVTPLELFMETANGKGARLIPRHSALPANCVKRFTTSKDNQTSISFIVRQGSLKHNVRLGTLIVQDLEPAKAGQEFVTIEFGISKSGLMTVKATNDQTGKTQKLDIKRSFA